LGEIIEEEGEVKWNKLELERKRRIDLIGILNYKVKVISPWASKTSKNPHHNIALVGI
jgi:hypothetical protein